MIIYTFGLWQIIIVFIAFLFVYTPIIVTLVDIYKGDFKRNKWTWFVLVFLFNYIGVVFYLLIGRHERNK